MKDLAKHIEILLLNNDCVIVPHLGGFIAHYVPAKYDEADSLFLPPMRTVGFNPQLTINDSLLAQSYADAYDISIPEALQRIEQIVKEVKTQLDNTGKYDINGIGLLSITSEGKTEFAPNHAGILSPDLYALDSFGIKPVLKTNEKQNAANEKDSAEIVEMNKPKTITIKVSTLRKAAVAAIAILALVLFLNPIDLGKQGKIMSGAIQNMMPKNITMGEPAITHDAKSTSAYQEATKKEQVEQQKNKELYCIVLASGTIKKNAEWFTENMHKKGYSATRLFQDKKDLKVVYGNYNTKDEAYAALKQLHTDKDFKQGWVMKIEQ